MNSVEVRDVQKDDIAAITRIYAEAVADSCASWEWEAPDAQEIERRCDKVLAKGYPYRVAVKNGVVVGFAYAAAFRNRAAYAPVVENSIYVDSTMRKSGVGRALLDDLIKACERIGYRQMIALIGDDDKSASVALHKACGFITCGTLPGVGWKHGHWMELVMMVRPLGDGIGSAPELF